MTTVSIIIVNYFTRDYVRKCVRSIADTIGPIEHEILVVDNSHTDGVGEVVDPSTTVLTPSRNLGFGAACNLAAERASGRHLLLINPDVVVLPGAIQGALACAGRHPGAGIVGARTVQPDGSLNPGSCWRMMTTWSLLCRVAALDRLFHNNPLLNREGYGGWSRGDERPVEVVTGCFLLIGRDLWDHLGGFDERFFVYGEDADLCLRAAQLGYHPRLTPDATVIHTGGSSEPVKAGKMSRLLTAKVQLVRKHAPPRAAARQERLLLAWPYSRYLASRTARALGVTRAQAAQACWREVWGSVRHTRNRSIAAGAGSS
ncbi:hypothetical protein SAMN05216241_102213 [Limimonas halophila]|uniref:Glycosyltransferase 2-like domain-containing protein n=2 Tax=Limimonas halophila TaxID=1082479 RepID=A0A1G7NN95_9PROT|nr:hypothetical protein SAMN05216241_102213 [Limimonas halophila]